MTIFDHIKNYSELVIFFFLKLILPTSNPNIKSILFINTGEIGDLLVSSLLLENQDIFDNYKKVQFLIKDKYLELLKNYNGKVKIIGYNKKKYKSSLIYKCKLLSKLRNENFGKCVHLTAARGILNEEITHLVGAKEVIALNSFWKYLGNIIGKYFDKQYTRIIGDDVLNEYEKHIKLINFLRGTEKEIIFNMGRTFEEYGINYSKFQEYNDFIAISPFTSSMNRDWRKKYFMEICYKLSDKHKVILLGSANQRRELAALCDEVSNVEILAGGLKLNEMPLFLKNAKLYIGLDSGLTHIALKIGIPIIAIIGGGEFGRFFPYKESHKARYLYSQMDCFLCHWECSKSEMFCMTDITPQLLINEVEKVLFKI